MSEENEKKSPTLDDFIITEKVDAFCKQYRPVKEHTFATEAFNEERLREFFKAYELFSQGDPLKVYIDELAARGYCMSVTVYGEPAIIVEEKID